MKLIEHLKTRGMNPKLYSIAKCYSTSKITFLLYNLSGQLVGYQHYRPKSDVKAIKNNPKLGRYFTKIPKHTIGVFGLEVLDPNKQDCYIVEGVFKAAKLHRLGFNAIAVLTSTPEPMKSWFYALSGRYNLIAIGDNDKAGSKLVKIVGKGFQSPLDLDEMDDESVRELLKYEGSYL